MKKTALFLLLLCSLAGCIGHSVAQNKPKEARTLPYIDRFGFHCYCKTTTTEYKDVAPQREGVKGQSYYRCNNCARLFMAEHYTYDIEKAVITELKRLHTCREQCIKLDASLEGEQTHYTLRRVCGSTHPVEMVILDESGRELKRFWLDSVRNEGTVSVPSGSRFNYHLKDAFPPAAKPAQRPNIRRNGVGTRQ